MKITLSPIAIQEGFVSINVLVTSATRKNRLAGQLGLTNGEFLELRTVLEASRKKGFELEVHPHLDAIGKV